MTSRAPLRARSGTMVSPGSPNPLTSPTLPSGSLVPIPSVPTRASPSNPSSTNSFTSKLKPRRPSLPNISASTSSIPTHKSIAHSLLLPSKEPTLRSPKSLPRMSADGGRPVPPSQIARPSTSLSRPSSAVSSPRLHTSPRMAATGRFSDLKPSLSSSISTTPSQATFSSSSATTIPTIPTIPTTTASSSSSSLTTSTTKPALKSQKSTGIKPPFIVTKPSSLNSSNSGNTGTGGSQKNNNSVSINSSLSSTSSTSSSSSASSLPPIAPSPSLPPSSSSSCLQTPQTGGCLMSTSMPTPLVTTKSTTPSHGSHAIAIPSTTEQNTRQTNTRSKNRLHAGIDSACYMTRSGSSDSSSSPSPPSSATSTPTIGMSAVMAPGTAPRTLSKHSPSLDSTTAGAKATSTSVYRPTKTNETTHPHPSRSRAGSITVPGASILKKSKPTLSMDMSQMSDATSSTSTLITTPTTPSPRRTTSSTDFHDPKRIGATPKGAFACQCPPPLEFPENVKQEMKREEEEHRQRECGLYAKIIELQIEVANLKGEKESLSRVVSRRDKMLLELQVQLQAMEFVCRENEIKVDVDMCPDEAIENWSFKESDEVYQRIILTTQELLRNGSRCLEEGMSPRTQSRPRTRISSTSSFSVTDRTKNVVGLSANSQPHLVQDVDPLLFKKTSRPGTLKFDMQTLLHSEQEFHNRQSKTPRALDLAQVNLAVERGPRRALDIGDDRSGLFRDSNTHQEADDEDDDDDEGQESEFEELGEDMIKYVELQSSMTPRRESRSSSFSKPAMPSMTPDMSTAVLMKNMWGSRRNTRTTPIQHPIHNGHFSPSSPSRSRLSHRGSSSSSISSSSNSILEDYYARPCEQPPATVGLGLSIGSSVHPHYSPHFNQLLSAPPTGAPPSHYAPMCRHPMSSPGYPMSSPGYPSPSYPMTSPGCPMSSPGYPMSSPGYPGSYYDHTGPPMMVRSATSQGNPTAVLPPPMMPLPPLPADRPRYSYRDHTKSKLLESRRPTHGRTCSHGFVIENVGQFLKRKTYGKMLTREIIYRGHRRRDSV